MNKQKPPKGIEWTRIRARRYGTARLHLESYGGCFHGCTWRSLLGNRVLPKTIAERFTSGYPHGFEHHYWRPHALDAPKKVKQSAVGTHGGSVGHWVPLGKC